jgi:hypothetical protein
MRTAWMDKNNNTGYMGALNVARNYHGKFVVDFRIIFYV